MTKGFVRALPVAVVLAFLNACGGGGSAHSATATSVDSTSSAETITTGSSEGDRDAAERLAQATNLTIDDLPDGWTSTPPLFDDDGRIFGTCGHLDLDRTTVARAVSDNFRRATNDAGSLNLATTTGVLASVRATQSIADAFATSDFADCVGDQIIDATGAPGMTGRLGPVPAANLPDVADQVAALSGRFTLRTSDKESTFHLTLVVVRTGKVLTTVSSMAIDTEPDGAILQDVVNLVADRQAG